MVTFLVPLLLERQENCFEIDGRIIPISHSLQEELNRIKNFNFIFNKLIWMVSNIIICYVWKEFLTFSNSNSRILWMEPVKALLVPLFIFDSLHDTFFYDLKQYKKFVVFIYFVWWPRNPNSNFTRWSEARALNCPHFSWNRWVNAFGQAPGLDVYSRSRRHSWRHFVTYGMNRLTHKNDHCNCSKPVNLGSIPFFLPFSITFLDIPDTR